MGEAWLSGTLDDPAETAPTVLAAAREAFAATGADGHHSALEAVLVELRTGSVLLDLSMTGPDAGLSIDAVPMEAADGAPVVPVFSSVDELALWRQRCERGDETVHYATVPGVQLADLIERDAVLMLDPASDAPLALPMQRIRGDQQ